MRELLFWALCLSCLFFIIKSFGRISLAYTFPTLFSLATFIFIIPTLFIFKNDAIYLTDETYNRFCINAFLCFWMGIAGYRAGNFFNSKPSKTEKVFYYNNITRSATYFIAIGGFASIFIDPKSFGDQAGGVFAIILFFSRFLRPAAIILWSLYLYKKSQKVLALFCVYLFFAMQFIVISGRRSETLILGLVVFFPLYFIKKVKVNRVMYASGMVIALLVVILLPLFRTFTKAGNFSSISSISVSEAVTDQISGEKSNEVLDAALNMEAVQKSGKYNYGVTFFNYFVAQFASSTLFGDDLKGDLTLEPVNMMELREKLNYTTDTQGFKYWLTPTGFGNAFIEFGFFGSLMYFLIGLLAARIYKKAMNYEAVQYKVLYCMFAVLILLSVYDSIPALPIHFFPYAMVYWFCFRKPYKTVRLMHFTSKNPIIGRG